MSATPSFLDPYIKERATRQPDEDTPPTGKGELSLSSTWGFEAPSNDQTKGWQVGNTVQLIEGASVWEVSTAFVIPGDSPRMERVGRLVPEFAGDDLEGAMGELGLGSGQWQEGPTLTFNQRVSDATAPLLESFRELGFDGGS